MCKGKWEFDILHIETRALSAWIADPSDLWQQLAIQYDQVFIKYAKGLASGSLTPEQYINKLDSALRVMHTNAHMIGQRMGGESNPMAGWAGEWAKEIADGESEFIFNYLQKLKEGGYGGLSHDQFIDVLTHRNRMYIQKSRVSAQEGFLDVQPSWIDIYWNDRGGPTECSECIIIADGSPYTKDTLYARPGDWGTPCGGGCRCDLTLSNGLAGPKPVTLV